MKLFYIICTGIVACIAGVSSFATENSQPTTYEPTFASISKHPLPTWYDDAKIGIIVHYGLYTVPGWATVKNPATNQHLYSETSYAAWYLNTMRITNSPTQKNYSTNYKAKYPQYSDFATPFKVAANLTTAELQSMTNKWATLFDQAGAKYAILTAKHHEGFSLWPTKAINPHQANYHLKSDILQSFKTSMKDQKIKFGLYYSGGFDWSWPDCKGPWPITKCIPISPPLVINSTKNFVGKMQMDPEYAKYAQTQLTELINYKPDVLWNDIALPSPINKAQLVANYYKAVPDGVINDRWAQSLCSFMFYGINSDLANATRLVICKDWYDFYDVEYKKKYDFTFKKWEADRGLGYAFAYNQNEYPPYQDIFMKPHDLIYFVSDAVAKNGNVLLGVGPDLQGNIKPRAEKLLLKLGDWLKTNGRAIYGTRPWVIQEGTANQQTIETRYTMDKYGQYLFVIALTNQIGNSSVTLLLDDLKLSQAKLTNIGLLKQGGFTYLAWRRTANGTEVTIPAGTDLSLPISLVIHPMPPVPVGAQATSDQTTPTNFTQQYNQQCMQTAIQSLESKYTFGNMKGLPLINSILGINTPTSKLAPFKTCKK